MYVYVLCAVMVYIRSSVHGAYPSLSLRYGKEKKKI